MNAITFRERAKSVLLDNYGKRKRDGARSGRWLGRNLALLAAGSDRIFAVTEKRKYTAYAVVLMIDGSSSMEGERLIYACQAAFLVRAEMAKLGIKVIVNAFSNHVVCVEKEIARAKTADEFASIIINYVYNAKLAGGTNEDRAVDEAHRLLMAEREYPGKVIITICDGEPNDGGKLRKSIKKARRFDIQALSLGICDSRNKRYYGTNQCATVLHPKHIYSAAARLLTNNMRRA